MNAGTPPYILLGNGASAVRVMEQMHQRNHSPLLLVMNENNRQREGGRLREAAVVAGVPVVEWGDSAHSAILERLQGVADAWILSLYFAHRLGTDLLHAVNGRAINVHSSLLPLCRGAHTNVWPIIDHCPAGVTIHAMVPELDAGPVLTQQEVGVEPWDTAGTLHRRLEDAAAEILLRDWPHHVLTQWPGQPQAGSATRHLVKDFASLARYEMTDPEVRRFFDLLRARSFPSHPGLKIVVDGQTLEALITLRASKDA